MSAARRMFCMSVSVLAALWLTVASTAAADGQRLALLIGNQTYTDAIGPLENPHNDVAVLGKALEKIGFKVEIERNLTYRAMDIAIKRHARRLSQAGKNAVGFFYYSGHGIASPDTRINYLVPTDAEHARDDSFWDAAYEQNLIIDRLRKRAPNATHFVVFDACRNELRITARATKNLNREKGMMAVADVRGIVIAYATAPGETASDAGDGVGPYARILAEEIVRPGIEAVTMFRNVQNRMQREVQQEPWLSLPWVPFIFLAGKDVPKPPPTPSITTPASVSQDMSMNILMTTCIRAPPSPNAKVIVGELARYMTERNFQVGWLPNNPGIAMADHLPLSHPLIMWSQAGFLAGSANILQLTLFPSGDTFGVIPVEFPGATDGDKPTVMLHGAWRGRNGQGCVAIKMNDSEGRGIVYPYPMMHLSQAMFLRPGTGPPRRSLQPPPAMRRTTSPANARSPPPCQPALPA
jgi:hypothetical protein